MADPSSSIPNAKIPSAQIIGFPPRTPTAKPVSGGLVRAVLEKAQDTLGQALGKLFEQADDTLFDLAGPNQGHGSGSLSFFEGFREMRRRRPTIERVFRDQLAAGFAEWEAVAAQAAGETPEAVEGGEPSPAPSLGELSLVSDDQFEEDLAITAMTTHAENLVRSERPALERRLAVMRGASEKENVVNPLAPAAIGAAFKKAMAQAEDVDLPVRLVVYKLFDRMVMVRLPELYHQVNRDLAAAGVLPELQAAPRQTAPTGAGRSLMGGEPAEVSLFGNQPAPAASAELGMTGLPDAPIGGFSSPQAAATALEAELGNVLSGGGTGAGIAGGDASSGVVASNQVADLLRTLLMRAAAPSLPAGVGMLAGPGHASHPAMNLGDLPAHLALGAPGAGTGHLTPAQAAEHAHLVGLLGRLPAASVPVYSANDMLGAIANLRMAPAGGQVNPGQIRAALAGLLANRTASANADAHAAPGAAPDHRFSSDHEVAIEMISMLFEFIVEDHALSPEMRATLGRLQLPYLRAAIHDPEWFSKEDHPARVLLNRMAEAGKGCPEHDHSPLVELIEQTVARIYEAGDDDGDIFPRENESFATQLAIIRQRSDRIADRARQTITARERRESSRRQVAERIVEMLEPAVRLPDPLREVVVRAWAHNMVMLMLRFGEESAELAKATRVVDFLARLCAAGPLSESDRRQLDIEKIEIDRLWREGLFYAGLHESDVRSLGTRLESLCADLLDPLAIAAEQRDRGQLMPVASRASADDPALVIARIPHTSILEALEPTTKVELSPQAMEPMAAPATEAASALGEDAHRAVDDAIAQATGQAPAPFKPAAPMASPEPLADGEFASLSEPAAPAQTASVASRFPGFEIPALPALTPIEVARSLQKDQWIELRSLTETRRLRLCWVSGLTGRLLFVNTYGQNGWDTTREEVANYIATGDVTLVENGEVVERAMTTIRERLRQRLSGILGARDQAPAAG